MSTSLGDVSGERLLAFAAAREGTPFGHAEHGMIKWARAIVDVSADPFPP